MAAIRVLVADEADITLTGICTILGQNSAFQVIDKAATGSRLCSLYAEHRPDICLASSNLADLTIAEILNRILKSDPEPKLIVLGDSSNLIQPRISDNSGIAGYLSKSISKKELIQAILKVSKGNKVSDKQSKRKHHPFIKPGEHLTKSPITRREREILHLIADGHTSQEIARLLYISPRTVEKHRSNLLQKLNIKNTAGLVRYAIQEGHVS